MNLNSYTSALQADLSAAAALGDDHTRQVAEALGRTAEASARLMLITALSDFASDISEELGDRSVHVRLDGVAVHAEVRHEQLEASEIIDEAGHHPGATADGTSDDYPTMDEVTGEVRRVTLRMVEHVKERAEAAANNNGMSLNSWLSQAVQGALRDQMRREQTRRDRPRDERDRNK